LPEVYCLPAQLNQVFMNLLVNAGQAIEDKGEITIRTGIDASRADHVWVEIGDTGKGIPEASLGRIFEPFYTTKPVGKGTGLGLSLSYSIVKKHHGSIEVSSRVGVGSTFRVILPVKPEPGPAGEAPQP
jgi:signal transduction histidine kinase